MSITFNIGDQVKVIKNIDSPFYDFTVGKIGTIVNISNACLVVQFNYDDPHFQLDYLCHLSEVVKTENL